MTATTPLTCDGFANALADYLERDDTPRVRAAVEAHAASCASCGSLLADLQQLRVDAAGLPTLSPSRDLWEGIAERIEAPVIELGPRARGSEGRKGDTWRPAIWMRPVAAAAALVLVTAGVTYYATREALLPRAVAVSPVDSTSIDPQQVVRDAIDSAHRLEAPAAARVAARPDGNLAPRPSERGAVGVRTPRTPPAAIAAFVRDQPPVAAVETVYGREIERLWRIVDQRRAMLDTATIGVIERNLVIIDQAIRESRAALARDPASALLNDQLNKALEQKVEVLRAAALLPVRS